MDLRSFYKKVHETEAGLHGEHFVVVSQETSEGGKAGVRTEASRRVAARLIAEGRARLATEEEARAFYESHRAAKEAHEQEAAARWLQVMVIPSHELTKAKEIRERS